MFDPTKYEGSNSSRQSGIAAGEYLLSIESIERKQGKNGPYLRARFEVVYGPRAGAHFWSNIGINVASSAGTAARLAILCKCVGQTAPFDLNDDRSIARAIVGKPFKARIKRVENGGYVNNDIERYMPELTDEERRAADGWVLDRQEAEAMGDSYRGDDADMDDLPF